VEGETVLLDGSHAGQPIIPCAKEDFDSVDAPAVGPMSGQRQRRLRWCLLIRPTIIGTDTPTASAFSIHLTVDKIGGRWLFVAPRGAVWARFSHGHWTTIRWMYRKVR
jgi:hypothetical protein